MSPTELCDQLLAATDPATRSRLLEAAREQPECAGILFDRARGALASAPEEALRAAELAVLLTEGLADGRAAANARRVQGQALRLFGRHVEAADALAQAASHARAAGELLLACQVQIGAIDSLGWLGRYEEALTLADRLEAELHALDAEADAAKVLVNVANLQFRRDQYTQALASYERAGEVFARLGDTLAQARVQANSANILTNLHRTQEALALFEQARNTFEAHGLTQEATMVEGSIGYVRYVSGMYSGALASFARAHRAFSARGQEIETAEADLDMADTCLALNLFPEALEHYEAAREVFTRKNVGYEAARSELGRAAVLRSVGRSEEALAGLDRADQAFRAQKNRLQRANVRLTRAEMLHAEGRTAEARREAHTAARTFAKQGLRGWAAEARFLLAETDLEAGQNATRRMRAIARAADQHSRGWLECRARRALGRFYRERGDLSRALRELRAGVAALEASRTLIAPEEMHVSFLRNKLGIYEDLIAALLARGRRRDVTEALEYVERSRSRLLLERLQSALEGRATNSEATSDTEIRRLRARIAELRAELSRGYHLLHTLEERDRQRLLETVTPEATDAEYLRQLERDYLSAQRALELATYRENPGTFTASVPALADVQAVLSDDEVLLEFYTVGDTLCAFALTRKGIRIWPCVASMATVTRAARRLRFHLSKSGIDTPQDARAATGQTDIQNVLGQLYDLLLRPLEAGLAAKKIVLVPHGALHGLPFHAFHDGACYALDRWEFVYAPSAAVWHAGVQIHAEAETTKEQAASMLLMAVPSPGIEQVAVEFARLSAMLPQAIRFCAEEATTEAFRAHAPHCRRIHLATHALFRADNPLFSGLRFADGWLLARDLYEMRLDCDLATLSACRTGVSYVEPGDELFGLLRGFLSAGARSVAVSFWAADDQATAELMERFYALLAQGLGKAAALRAAQQETRARYPHPYHWAAFALVGQR